MIQPISPPRQTIGVRYPFDIGGHKLSALAFEVGSECRVRSAADNPCRHELLACSDSQTYWN